MFVLKTNNNTHSIIRTTIVNANNFKLRIINILMIYAIQTFADITLNIINGYNNR